MAEVRTTRAWYNQIYTSWRNKGSNKGPRGTQAMNKGIFCLSRMIATALAAVLLCSAVARAAEDRGPVTNLPIPRYVSLKASEGNVRRGPSLNHRIDWVFKHRNMPLEVTGEYGHWRRVIDRDGVGGWVHYSLLSGMRTVIVEQE